MTYQGPEFKLKISIGFEKEAICSGAGRAPVLTAEEMASGSPFIRSVEEIYYEGH